MNFNSAAFLVFLGVFFLGWKVFEKRLSWKWAYLTFASFFFYGWWNWHFLALLIGTGTIDFLLGRGFDYVRRPVSRKALLIVSICTNLAILFSFKYSSFLCENLDHLGQLFGQNWNLVSRIPAPFLILPIGISFYTFESLSYIIDIYRGHIKPTRNYFHFFAFLSMFPRLVAGPIERPSNLLPQLLRSQALTPEMRWNGLVLIVQGYFKKVVIADNLAPFVNQIFASPGPVSSATWWLATTAFAAQIYCDFSGYTDIARGLANWLGYEFRINFNHPYQALGFSDFWKRWHISLSSWFRDYVYIPLGGDRKGPIRTYCNLWVTMLLSGFWHGAQWTFISWGALHAFYLSIERLTRWPERFSNGLPQRIMGVALTFMLTTIAWVFFRAVSLDQALMILQRMFIPSAGESSLSVRIILLLGLLALHEVWFLLGSVGFSRGRELSLCHPLRRAWLVFLIILSVYARGPGSSFIYFQF